MASARPDVPRIRIREINDAPVAPERDYVLYWMTAARRLVHSFALDRAVGLALELGKPLLVFEPLRLGYPHASDRMHAFILQGMAENAEAAKRRGVAYFPYVESDTDADKGLLAALGSHAAAVVTDDHPGIFYPHLIQAGGRALDVRLEAVDGIGLLPMAVPATDLRRAYDFRRLLQRELPEHLHDRPLADPLALLSDGPKASVPKAILESWPRASAALLRAETSALAALPIDHDVPAVAGRVGGTTAGMQSFDRFRKEGLATYGERRNDILDEANTSRLSPYLHFGHVGTHQVFDALLEGLDWSPADVAKTAKGAREGWWNLPAGIEAFLDQVVTWRELGFNFNRYRDDADRFSSLPGWAKDSLAQHAEDEREHVYTRRQFEAATTHDPLWNAAQRELVETGSIHNYLRMLWGKKILHWSKSPQDAAKTMIYLNDRYGLDGRDPNSYSGIFWVLGRYDRAWGPERPIFGKIRYMTSDSTRRKMNVKPYLERYGKGTEPSATLF
ncbi:MAG: deoxyribodipyrimidine photolyase [Planctomycetota bacterium]|nr:deoxyribodipyrimidine photolyase [Planctomycetota bacterium]